MATWCKQLTHLKKPWCWERLRVGGEGDNQGWDGWMASPTQWTWVWVKSGSWWWTRRPGMRKFMRLQRVGHDWATELNWTELILFSILAVSVYISTISTRGFPFLHIMFSSNHCRFFYNYHSDWYEVILHCSFDLHFKKEGIYVYI